MPAVSKRGLPTGAERTAAVAVGLLACLLVFRALAVVAKIAVPIAALLFVGNLAEWQWAKDATDWLRDAGTRIVEAAESTWAPEE